jgi:hypothetical protein
MKSNTPTIETLEFASNIREAHCLILEALEVLQKNNYLPSAWTEDNGVLDSLNLDVAINLESVLFNHLFKLTDVLKEKGVDYEPINPVEYGGKVESSEFTSDDDDDDNYLVIVS